MHDPVMSSHLASKKSRAKYTSPVSTDSKWNNRCHCHSHQRKNYFRSTCTAKYFCVILDTTPDISHIDQLAFSLRYVLEGKPVERFLCFEAVDFLHKLLQLLAQFNIDSKFIRGQAMDELFNNVWHSRVGLLPSAYIVQTTYSADGSNPTRMPDVR